MFKRTKDQVPPEMWEIHHAGWLKRQAEKPPLTPKYMHDLWNGGTIPQIEYFDGLLDCAANHSVEDIVAGMEPQWEKEFEGFVLMNFPDLEEQSEYRERFWGFARYFKEKAEK